MQKPIQLRQRLIEQIPSLGNAPEKLTMTTGAGNIVATSAPSLSFEYRYPLTVIFSDNTTPEESLVDHIVVTVLDWLRVNQPEITGNASQRSGHFAFALQANSMTLTLELTERIQVTDRDGVRTIIHLPEPPLPENVALPRQVYLNGELISSWTE